MSETGRCLCGKCQFTATPEKEAGICHCEMCRKWSGGIYIAVSCKDVVFNEDAPLGVYHASDWGERVFCQECGSSLMWRSRDHSSSQASIQAFDNPGAFTLTNQIFIDSKPENYALQNDTKTMTGAQVMAMFAPKPEGQ